jgi:ATP-dependent DNA helicase RecG
MDEMPVGRLPVETHVMHPLERERAYQLIRSQVDCGKQAFIIYPLVEQGDRDEGKAAVEGHAHLQKNVFPKLRIGLVHGRLRPEQKDEVMRRFRDGEYHVLVSTSVIEVGVDVPNATVMVIEGANRFGLSQLHQFRGRVGRGSDQSYCLLIPEDEGAIDNERLAAMEETTDGFVLAEKDLEQRGPGDFLGTRQSGFADLRMANLMDVRLIEKARKHAQEFFDLDPNFNLPEYASLYQKFHQFWGSGRGDIS